jgi:hypothetical protein
LCLLNYEIEAEKISDLDNGEELIKKLLLKIKNLDLRFLLGKMSEWKFETRFSIDECLVCIIKSLMSLKKKGMIIRSEESSELSKRLTHQIRNKKIN